MDVAAIRRAVNDRLEQLELKNEELRRRMAEIRGERGASTKIVDLLVNDRPKKWFERPILRAASVALEWPDHALEVIEAGEATPDQLPHRPWGDRADSGQARADELADQLAELASELDETRAEVAGLRDAIIGLSRVLLSQGEELSREELAARFRELARGGEGEPR